MKNASDNSPVVLKLMVLPVGLLLFLGLPVSPARGDQQGPVRLDPSAYAESEPVARYNAGMNLFYQERYERARSQFFHVRQLAGNRDLIENASFMNIRCLYEIGEYVRAYEAVRRFERAYSNSKYWRLLLRYKLDIGFQLMNGKDYRSFLGLHIFSATDMGTRIVRNMLNRFPHEPFSATYQYRLANFYFSRKEYGTAAGEYRFLVKEYRDSIWHEPARFLIGLSYVRSVESTRYDTKNLKKADRHFEIYLENFPDGMFVKEAKKFRNTIDEKRARKDFRTANWYTRTGRREGAIFYYKEVIRNFPDTKWASRAASRLEEFDSESAALSEQLKQKIKTRRAGGEDTE